jgi:beta,beta-carotene 9',10'-dioxygenase
MAKLQQANGSSVGTTPWAAGLQSVERELDGERLAVEGEIPSWLNGTLIRNGPAKFEAGERKLRHWFDGFAMLHGFSIDAGSVTYTNRYLDTQAYRTARDDGRIDYKEFATDPCRSIFKRITTMFSPHPTDNANVNVAKLGGKFVAMTETPMAVDFDAATLKTAGVVEHDDGISTNLTTAHPHLERGTGDGFNYALGFSRTSTYTIHRVRASDGERVPIARIPVREPSYMHSFGLTENFIVLAEFPLLLNPLRLLLSGKPFIENYRWKPERGTRFHLINRRTGTVERTVVAPAFFAFHHVNAFEENGAVLVDIAAFDDSSVIEDLYLSPLRGEDVFEHSLTKLKRYRLTEGSVEPEVLSEEPIELPRINYGARNERPYRYVYGVGLHATEFLNRLLKIDVTIGDAKVWRRDGCFPGEPVFVPAPGGTAEDEGVVLSAVLDSAASTSFLLVLDGSSFTEIARAHVPQVVPFGFHGSFFSDALS